MMATFEFPLRRLIIAGGFAVAVAAAPAVGAFALPTDNTPIPLAEGCHNGEEADVYTGNCVPHTVPISPSAPNTSPNAGFGSIPGNPNMPEIRGIPCTGANTGECIGLAEQAQAAGPGAEASSSVGHSPTVHGGPQ